MASRRMGRIIAFLLLAGLVSSWLLTMKIERDRRQLAGEYAQSRAAVTELTQTRTQLQEELGQTRQSLDSKTTELSSLQDHLDKLQVMLTDAEQEVERLHTEQAMILQSQESLTSQLAASTRQRQELEVKLSSLKELKAAIRTVKNRLREERWQAWLARLDASRVEDQRKLAQGNRGYVVRNGTSTLLSSASKFGNRLQVRVLEPQSQ